MLEPDEYADGTGLPTDLFELSGVTVAWVGQEPFKADAADRQKGVAIEFISQRDCEELDRAEQRENRKDGALTFSSVHLYDFPKTSRYLAEKVKNTGRTPVYFGTFYDPLSARTDYRSITNSASLLDAEARIVTESKRLLRLQVEDFVKWLQGQGAM